MLVIPYLLLIGANRWGTRTNPILRREVTPRRERRKGRSCGATGEPGGSSGNSVRAAGRNISAGGWSRSAGSDNEMKQTAVWLTADSASHVNPRCRHATPLVHCPFS